MRLFFGGFILAAALLFTPLLPRAHAQFKAAEIQPVTSEQAVEFNVYLPLQHPDELDSLLQQQNTRGSASYHKWLTPAEFRSRFGPSQQDIDSVTGALKYYGFTVVGTNSHGVRVRGTADMAQRAFATSLSNVTTKSGARIIAAQGWTLPPELQKLGAQVVHFLPLPEAQPQVRQAKLTAAASPANRVSPYGGYWFDDLKQAYRFPSYLSLDGTGRTIAIMAGSDYLDSDIAAYFAHESTKAAPISPPTIIRFPISGGSPFNAASGLSVEAELDLEQAGGMAPGATLVLVILPDTTYGSFIDGYLTLVDDGFADIVNTSFTFGAEALFTAAYNGGIDFTGILKVFDDVFKQGNAEGMTFVESSGDMGGLPTPPLAYFTTPPQTPPVIVGHFLPGVEAFTSSWYITSVGGTNLETTYDPPSLISEYVSENAYGDPEVPYDPYGVGNLLSGGYWGPGGGKSILYGKPPYQEFIHTGASTRAVPDISLQMGGCPAGLAILPCRKTDSYTFEVFDGQLYGVIGTSVSAPDFTGVLALEEQYLGDSRLGNVNYDIYAIAAAQPAVASTPLDFLHQGQPGFNGAFYTTPSGYNFVLGVGTPLVKNFIFAPLLPAAGNPQTRSNP